MQRSGTRVSQQRGGQHAVKAARGRVGTAVAHRRVLHRQQDDARLSRHDDAAACALSRQRYAPRSGEKTVPRSLTWRRAAAGWPLPRPSYDHFCGATPS